MFLKLHHTCGFWERDFWNFSQSEILIGLAAMFDFQMRWKSKILLRTMQVKFQQYLVPFTPLITEKNIELWKAKGCRRQCTHNWHRVKTIPHMNISLLAHVRWKQTQDHINSRFNHYTGIGRPNVKLCTIYLLLYQKFLSQINKFYDCPTNNNSYNLILNLYSIQFPKIVKG